jgi:hypothetical protein
LLGLLSGCIVADVSQRENAHHASRKEQVPMRQIHENASAHKVDQALRFLRIRLGSRPDTKSLAEPVEQARQHVLATDTAWQEARDARRAATAEVQYLDELLDGDIMALSRETLVLTGGKRDDPRYQVLFPSAPSQAMAGVGSDAQARYVKQILTRLVEDPALAELRGKEKTIAARLQALEGAVAQRHGLYVPEASAQSDRRRAIDEARQLYRAIYHQLKLLLSDDALIESFFHRGSSTKAFAAEDTSAEDVS